MSNYGLKPCYAIHAASAINRKLKLMISDDQDFDGIKEIKRIPIT
jgi:predicted nucleic acid-binding protein